MSDNNKRIGTVPEKMKFLSGAQLKYIAFVSMLMDHVNKALIFPYLTGEGALQVVSNVFGVLGRIAFPIFAFLLVEGYFHTHNKLKYFLYLVGFGVISEVPFDMFATYTFVNPRDNNVMFSLAIALLAIWAVDALGEKMKNAPKALWVLASLPIVLVMSAAATFASVDYEWHAVVIVYIFYLFHKWPVWGALLGYASIIKEVWAFLGFGLTLTYNGQRGRQNKLVNYLFYPVHLLIIGLLRRYLGV